MAYTEAQLQALETALAKGLVAINADFFKVGYVTSGLAVGNGVKWPDTNDSRTYGTFAFDTTPLAPRVELQPPEHVMQPAAWMKGVVSGRPRVLANGAVLTSTASVCANTAASAA